MGSRPASNPAFEPVDNDYLRMTLHLENTGGPGVYVVEVWEWNTSPSEVPARIATTEPVEVAADYDETASWEIISPISAPPIHHITVLSRNQGSAQYRETDRYDVPFD